MHTLNNGESNLSRNIKHIALPMALQNLVLNLLNMVDTLMVSKVGEMELSAVGLANQPFFVFTLLLFGISSGACVLTSQYYGIDDKKSIKNIVAFAISFSLAMSFVIFLGVFFFPEAVMRFYTSEAPLIELGARYLKVASLSYVFTAFSATFLGIIVSVGEGSLPLKINSIALVVNTVLNYTFIFGNFGAPKMGAEGAALATVISRIIEFSIVIFYIFKLDDKIKMEVKDFFIYNKILIKDFFKYSCPVILNEFFWSFGMSLHSVILGHFSPLMLPAYNIIMVIERIVSSAQLGLGKSAAVIVGIDLGRDDKKMAYQNAKKLLIFGMFSGVFVVFTLIFTRYFVVDLLGLSEETNRVIYLFMLVEILYAIPRCIATIGIIGIFRGGGDTVFSALADALPIYFVAIPLGFVCAYFGAPIFLVYLALRTDEPVKLILTLWRFRGKKWMKNVTR